MRKAQMIIDNKRPEDSTYPRFKPAAFYKRLLFVEEGEYIVNDRGDVMIVTSGNKKWEHGASFIRSINAPYFRARYLGNEDDSLEYANQCRRATEKEILEAKHWTKSSTSFKIDIEGQLLLV